MRDPATQCWLAGNPLQWKEACVQFSVDQRGIPPERVAAVIEKAVDDVIAEGYRTPDIAGTGSKTVNTVEMGNLVAGKL